MLGTMVLTAGSLLAAYFLGATLAHIHNGRRR